MNCHRDDMVEKNNVSGIEFDWVKNSTHYKNWLIDSIDKLNSIQLNTYNNAVKLLQKRKFEYKIPSFNDELWLIKYYSFQLSQFVNSNNLKPSVKETSLVLFNRFYLRRSLLEYDPRIIMFTCITLATKLEDMWRSVYIDKLLYKINNLNITKVFEMESIVCDVLNFNLNILHLNDSIYILIQLLISYIKESLDVDGINEYIGIILYMLKEAEMSALIMNESPSLTFLYTPPQLTLSIILQLIKNTSLSTILSIESFVLKLLNGDEKNLMKLLSLTQSIMDEYNEFLAFRNELNQSKALPTPKCMVISFYSQVYTNKSIE
ncbi:cyclin, putative [Theileria annulata]|uniref:Cyclin, putative n=1 Tax=Theileria annulata TaxID=5874 RepID=Q4U9A0_THEAN|nr:cyclin, putative [Theileria annulata]CAI76603.1 cyclin, putative [Theileria annulata]|eukprot:XP_953228.1 cyclin, putative [Theileria annulata]